jgi:hypothetical protein
MGMSIIIGRYSTILQSSWEFHRMVSTWVAYTSIWCYFLENWYDVKADDIKRLGGNATLAKYGQSPRFFSILYNHHTN